MSILTPLVLLLAVNAQEDAPRPLERVTIVEVMATDLVAVKTATDPDLRVSLLGVGNPETPGILKPDALLGKLDPKWLAHWLPPGTPALMERRGETALGRPLVFLYRIEDRFCWNAHLVRSGGAFAAKQAEFREFPKFASMEEEARSRGLGLWIGYASPVPADRAEREPVAARRDINSMVFSPRNFTPPKKRKPYARQDWAAFDAQLAGMSPYGGYGVGDYGAGRTQHVRGYFRQDGTPVQGYWRRPPSR